MSSETMQAGREMNAEVATKVMGLRHWPRFPGDVAGYWCASPHPTRQIPCNLCVVDEALQPYSTDAAAALDALTQVGGIATLRRMRPDEWHVIIGSHHGWAAETLPHAICLALLDAVTLRSPEGAPHE